MDWSLLYFGKMNPAEVKRYVSSHSWQEFRVSLKGKTLEEKYDRLMWWVWDRSYCRAAQVQVTNYVTALSRGGLIKPPDYRR